METELIICAAVRYDVAEIQRRNKMSIRGCLMSTRTDWATPMSLFCGLDNEFHFNLDPCASVENAKCERFFTDKEDGLKRDWGGASVFCNPPYGREIGKWVRKAAQESRNPFSAGTRQIRRLQAGRTISINDSNI